MPQQSGAVLLLRTHRLLLLLPFNLPRTRQASCAATATIPSIARAAGAAQWPFRRSKAME